MSQTLIFTATFNEKGNIENLINQINSKIKGDIKPIRTRQDLDSLGKPKLKERVNL